VKTIFESLIFRNQSDIPAIRDLREWRLRVLDGILQGIFVVWIFALVGGVNNVYELYLRDWTIFERDLVNAVSLITIYLAATALLAVITFYRALKYELRAGLFLLILYTLGVVGLIAASLSGDGRIFLFAFIIFSAVFFEYRYSLFALALSSLTLVIIGLLQITAIIVVPADNQINSTDMGAWVSGSIVFFGLSVAALISIVYLLLALAKSLGESRESLSREQNLSRMLRTISNINQLIMREQDRGKLLSEACEQLISGRGYPFVWIGLLEADGVTLKLAASAGETIDPELFTVRLDQKEAVFSCAAKAIHSRKYFYVEACSTGDPCLLCPRSINYPERFAIALPLFRDEHIFGVLVVDHILSAGVFDEEEVQLLQELADNLAYALGNLEANTRLQTYARHQTLLNEITQNALETPDLEAMLKKFIVGLEKALNADGYYIALWDEDRQLPVQFICSDALKGIFSDTLTKVKLGDTIFSQSILDCGHALVIDDIMNTPHISPHVANLFPARSALGLPLIANNQKFGTLVIGFREAHQFKPDEIELGEQASRQIAFAILKVRLDTAIRARATELGRLYAAALDMSFSMIDPPALLQKLAHHMTEALDATSGNIMSVNFVESTLQVVAEYWSEDAAPTEKHSDLGRAFLISEYSTIMDAMVAGKALILHAGMDRLTAPEKMLFVKYGIQSMLFVPIIANGKLLGSIEIWESRRRRDFTLAEIRLAQAMAGHAAGVIEKSRLFETLEQREAYFRALIENSAEGTSILDAQGIIRYVASSEERLTGYAPEEIIGQSAFQHVHPSDMPEALKNFTESVSTPGVVRTVQYRLQRKDGEWRHFEITGHNMLDDLHLNGIVLNYRDITERKEVEHALQESQSRLEAIISTALNGIITSNSEQQIVLFNPSAERIFGCLASEAIGQSLEKFIPERYRYNHKDHIRHYSETNISNRHKGLLDTLYGLRANGEEFPMEAFISQSEVNGQKFFTVIFQDITERKRAEENLRRRAMELETIVSASSALRTAHNVTEMVPVLARQALRAVNGTYASIFLLDPETGEFVSHGWYSVDTPFAIPLSDEASLHHLPNVGITGRIVATGDIYVTEDIQKDPIVLILDGERERLKDVHGGISLPLRTQEKIIGIMHIWSLRPRIFTEIEIRLLIALAETASNAIHRATLFEQTLQHTDEITKAYDHTLAGWARALELRDEITEGHTRRVTELTLKLARAMNISEDEIVHIRRGALLHDIGKMGIPDSILHKPGPFTAQERFIMEQHTQYAYDMLSSISFLQSALDIPVCHHEHWDGNGYPRKLKGGQIPLSARIFTVVDVWDALTSDRPYRLAWTYEKTREYILERAGKQFDPFVVEVFFSLELE
jgi:PAS domain S-box-containing protein/putative nucleotidyltransferase with HDIG domain